MNEFMSDGGRFESNLDRLVRVLGHVGRNKILAMYCKGLVLPGERKSIEPMAAHVDSERVQARHQSMYHFVAKDDMLVAESLKECLT